jgi:hypothetical protein
MPSAWEYLRLIHFSGFEPRVLPPTAEYDQLCAVLAAARHAEIMAVARAAAYLGLAVEEGESALLAKLGADGWEFAAASGETESSYYPDWLIFKRELRGPG